MCLLKICVKILHKKTKFVFKITKTSHVSAPRGLATMSSVLQWVKSERYAAFPLVSGGNINEMADTGKLLTIFVINEHDPERKTENLR